jgi:acyl-CoA thioesterase
MTQTPVQFTHAHLPVPTACDGGIVANISSSWRSWTGAHGGVVTTLLGDAARAAVEDRPLRALTARLLRPVAPGPLVLQTTIEQRSRSTATAVVRALQDDALVALGLATLTATSGDLDIADRPAPAAPTPSQCLPYTGADLLFPFARQVEIRPATPVLPLQGTESSELTAWVRLRSTSLVDQRVALVLLDALAPAIYARLTTPVAVPTVELTAHLARDLQAAPYAGWVLARQRNTRTSAGISVDECDLFSTTGELLAQARQLRLVLG